MEKRTKLRLGLLLSTFVCVPSAQAILSSTNPSTTSGNITLAALDKKTGDFYIATSTAVAANGALGANATVGKFSIPTTATAVGTVLTGTAIQSSAAADAVAALSVSNYTGLRVCWVNSATTNVKFLNVYNGLVPGTSIAALHDGAGNVLGVTSALASNDSHVFALVNGTGAAWLADNTTSSIETCSINQTTMVPTETAAAVAGTIIGGAGGTRIYFTKAAGIATAQAIVAAITAPTAIPQLVYDSVFNMCYVASGCTSGAVNGNGARSIMMFTNTSGVLQDVGINGSPATAWTNLTGIVGTIVTDATAKVLTANYIGIMHTSTGFHYLIVNGGINNVAVVNNSVWALPLVSPGFTNQGTFADVASVGFSTQAADATQMYSTASIPAIVGNAVLPWQAGTLPSCMQIVGDTVYISNNTNTANSDEPGIFYSQAIFGGDGKIARWTRWEKAVPAAMGTSDNAAANGTNGSINFFGVDARSGRIWSVPTSDGVAGAGVTGARMVKLSNWADTQAVTNTTANGTLAAALSATANLPEGVWSVYNVGRSSVNFGAVTTAAYTAFGGQGKVTFARTDIKAASVLAYQITPPTDFTLAANLLTTTLPAGAGVVQALGYSHWAVGAADGFFFAGTNAGLYVYSLAIGTFGGEGFTANTPLAALNVAPWSTAGNLWTQISNVTGAVRKIRAIGGKVYILARDNNGGAITDYLYGVSVQTTVANINTNIQTLAVSGAGNLANATVIEDFEIVGGAIEQVLLATNDGLYESQAVGGLQGVATQTLAVWTQVNADAAYTLLHGQNRLEFPTSITGSYIADNSDGKGTFDKSLLDQILVQGTSVAKNPVDFTENVFTDIFPSIITSYWSDGARRFISTAPGDGTLNLQTLPYKVDSTNFNMTAPMLGLDRVNGKNVHAIAMMPNGYAVACLGPDGIAVL